MTDLDNYVWKGGNTTRGVERRGGKGRKAVYPKGTAKRLSTIVLSEAEYEILRSLGGNSAGVRKLLKAHLAAQAVIPGSWDDVPALLKPQAE